MNRPVKRVAIMTGVDPGLNAVVRPVVLAATVSGLECYGVREGVNGILAPGICIDELFLRLWARSGRGIGHHGGAILGCVNRPHPMR